MDASAARDYYDWPGIGLGNRFIDGVFAAIVYFKVEMNQVSILAVYHTARDPDQWDDPSRD